MASIRVPFVPCAPVVMLTRQSLNGIRQSDVKSAVVGSQGGLADGFGQGGMGVTRSRDIFRASAEFHDDHRLGDQFGCVGSENMRAEQPVGPRVGEQLDKTLGSIQTASSRISGKWELADAIL